MLCGAVVLFDDDGSPTLGGAAVGTLCGGPSWRMLVSSFSIFACFIFSVVDSNRLDSAIFNKSAAARSVRSASDSRGILQCVG